MSSIFLRTGSSVSRVWRLNCSSSAVCCLWIGACEIPFLLEPIIYSPMRRRDYIGRVRQWLLLLPILWLSLLLLTRRRLHLRTKARLHNMSSIRRPLILSRVENGLPINVKLYSLSAHIRRNLDSSLEHSTKRGLVLHLRRRGRWVRWPPSVSGVRVLHGASDLSFATLEQANVRGGAQMCWVMFG